MLQQHVLIVAKFKLTTKSSLLVILEHRERMKKTLCFFIGILILSCVNKTDSQTKSNLAIKAELKSIEIQYSNSREKTIDELKTIWECKHPMIAKSETNFNGNISYNITIMISGFKPVDDERKETNIKLTASLIKESVLNYREFSDLKIITSYTTSDGARRTSSKTIKMTDL